MGQEKLAESRLRFIDVARSFAIIFMLEGHFISLVFQDYHPMFDAIKEHGTSGNIFYDYWVELRRYTAPLFFTITGLVFAYLLTGHKGESFWKQKRVSKGWRRGLQIIFWGYFLQFNWQYLFEYLENGLSDKFYLFHVLQCIGFGILILIFLYAIHHRFKQINFALILFIGGLLVFAFNPVFVAYGDNYVPAGAPLIIQNMIHGPDSVFPFFPWLGFILFGGCMGALIRQYSKHVKKLWFPLVFVAVGLAGIYTIKMVTVYMAHESPTHINFIGGLWLYGPLKRVIIFLGILMYAEQFIKFRAKYFIAMGQNTLNIYIVHAIILYGCVFGYGIKDVYNKNLTFGQATIGALLFILFFGIMTHFQPQIKKVLMFIPNLIFPPKEKT